MADYKGNFYSTNAYDPDYNATKIGSLVKKYTVLAADVTATKALLTTMTTANIIAIVYRASVALPTNFTLATEADGIYLKGNANYTLTAGDVVVYIAQE